MAPFVLLAALPFAAFAVVAAVSVLRKRTERRRNIHKLNRVLNRGSY